MEKLIKYLSNSEYQAFLWTFMKKLQATKGATASYLYLYLFIFYIYIYLYRELREVL